MTKQVIRKITITIIILLIISLIIIYFQRANNGGIEETKNINQEDVSLSLVSPAEAMENMPQTNPFELNVNPFSFYTNPF